MLVPTLGSLDDFCRLVPKPLGEFLVPWLHLLVRHVELGFSSLMSRDLRRHGALSIRFGQIVLDLLATRTGRVEVLTCVASDFRLAAATALYLVAERGQSRCRLGSIDRRGELLRPVQLARLQWTHCTVCRLREVEDDRVGMELRRGIAVHRPGAVVLKQGRYRIAGRFRPAIATEPRLRVRLELLEGDAYALTVRRTDALVAADQRREGHALRRRERRVPTGPVLHRRRAFAPCRHLASRLVPNELFTSERMLPLGKALEVRLPYLAGQTSSTGKLAVPHAANHRTFGVVVFACVLEFLFVIAARLAGAQRFGDREHRQPSLEERLLLHDRGRGRPLVGDDRLRHR